MDSFHRVLLACERSIWVDITGASEKKIEEKWMRDAQRDKYECICAEGQMYGCIYQLMHLDRKPACVACAASISVYV